MAFSKQGGFKKGGGFRNDRRPSGFQKREWGDRGDRGDRGALKLHHAVCAECGRDAEVPFKPIPGKQIFCKDCFARRGGTPSFERGDRPERQDRPERFPRRNFDSAPSRHDSGSEDMKRELQMLNAKMDRLINAVERMAERKPEGPSLGALVADAAAPKAQPKKSAKKPAKKGKK